MTFTIFYLLFAIGYVTACIKMVHPDMEGLPVTDMPVTHVPVTIEPITSEPITNEPITNEPVTNEPVTNGPVTDESVTNEPVTDEPVTDEPVTDEPVTDEPVTDEPITDEPITVAPTGCNSCKIASLFNEEDLALETYYHPDPENIVDYTGTCVSYTIKCATLDGPAFTYIKDVNGNTLDIVLEDPAEVECGDDGIFDFQGTKVVRLWCGILW